MRRSAILSTTDRAYRDVTEGRFNPNGCPFVATMFTQEVNTRERRHPIPSPAVCMPPRPRCRRPTSPAPVPHPAAECDLAVGLWEDGYEIATHTANHIQMPEGYAYNDTVAEILGAKRFLSRECGIPADEIRGFRSPYLVTNPVVRQVRRRQGGLPAARGRRAGT